jgi:hypothetical protein
MVQVAKISVLVHSASSREELDLSWLSHLCPDPWLLSVLGQIWDSNARQQAYSRHWSGRIELQRCDRSIKHGTLGLVQPSHADIEAVAFGLLQPVPTI